MHGSGVVCYQRLDFKNNVTVCEAFTFTVVMECLFNSYSIYDLKAPLERGISMLEISLDMQHWLIRYLKAFADVITRSDSHPYFFSHRI